MRVPPPSLPQSGEIQFQISLLNIVSLGQAETHARELEKLLVEQEKH